MKLENDSLDSRVDKIIRRRKIARKTGKCDICSPHDGENRSRHARDDRHKNHRRK